MKEFDMMKPLIASLAIGLLSPTFLPAQPPPAGPQGFRPGPPPGMPCDLDLTSAQKEAIQAILEKHRTTHMEKQKAARQKEKALMAALFEGTAPEARLKELHQAASDARFALLLEDRATRLEVDALLTPEQRARRKTGMEGRPMGEQAPPPMP
jgi:Spy/CpxP family protein refolding chaperone